MKLSLPGDGWRTRPYQDAAWNAWIRDEINRIVLVWHRRAGKDKLALNGTCIKAHQKPGVYWHLLPEAAQARKAIWDAVDEFTGKRLIDQAFPLETRASTRESDMFIRFKCGSTWQVVGSDNYDSLIGSPPRGVVFSEFAYANPAAWQKLSPILLNNGGWAAFISTPFGRNHFHGLYEFAKHERGWYAQILTVDDTHLLTREQITGEERQLAAQRGIAEAQAIIQQEYYCSFVAAIPGAYYGQVLEQMERSDPPRITVVPYDPGFTVETWWDLGIRDDTAIWFVQRVGREYRVIDYYESAGEGIDHYAQVLHGRCPKLNERDNARRARYNYAELPCVLPHDAGNAQLSQRGGASLAQILSRDYGWKNRVVPETSSLQWSIQQVRTFLPLCVFDAANCKDGLDKLRQYRRKWDPNRRAYHDVPLHDFCFTGDTEVLTRYGTCQIMDLPSTGEVLTSCGWKRYTNPRVTRRAAQLVAVKFSDGLTVRCTPDHLFKTASGWKSAESLRQGLLIQSCWMHSRSISTTDCGAFGRPALTTRVAESHMVRAARKSCIERFGNLLSGQSLVDATFTIATATHKTTRYQTLSAWTQKSISVIRGIATRANSIADIFLKMLDPLLLDGINPMPAVYGISGTQKNLGSEATSERSAIAKRVVSSTTPSIVIVGAASGFAPTPARLVHIESVEHLSVKNDVWCLTVPDADEFALSNGALVHNCSHSADAFRTGVEGLQAPIRQAQPTRVDYFGQPQRPRMAIVDDDPLHRGF